jgi:energy-coupling factor transport system permease protein
LTRRFIIGQYRPSDSFGHRLDPRGKVIFAVFLMIFSIFTTSILFYGAVILGMCLLIRLSGISIGTFTRNMRPFIILVSITAIYHLLFSARETPQILNIFGFRLTEGGLLMAASFSLRIIVFVVIAFFISLTTPPDELGETMVGWLKPLNGLKVPVSDIGLIVFIAMRFVPVLAEEFDTIRKAQMIRGVDFSGGLIKRARRLVFLLIPVFQSAIRRADDLAIAIESRGYISGLERSSYRNYKFAGRDYLFMIASWLLVILLYILTKGRPYL